MLPHKQIQIIEAASILGLRSQGVDRLPLALQQGGLLPDIYTGADHVIKIPTLNDQYNAERDKTTSLLNGPQIAQFSRRLSDALAPVIRQGRFALVLGGDCSILIGAMLALRQLGRYGLAFVDAHADFYQPEASVYGEVADMDLGIVCGRGPDILSNIDGKGPYVAEEAVVHIGQRDMEEAERYHSRDIRELPILRFDINYIREKGIASALRAAVQHLQAADLQGYWIHFDADVLADDIMPAVDYRLPGGLTFEEAALAIRTLTGQSGAVGMTVTIFNPAMDQQGDIARNLADCLNKGLAVS